MRSVERNADVDGNEIQRAENQASAREILAGIARRLPSYAQLTMRLAQDTRMSANQRAPLVGLLGRGLPVLDLVPGIVPVIGRFNGLLGMFQTISVALAQLQPDVAEEHLKAVGLTREQVESDVRATTDLARRLAALSSANLGNLTDSGARSAGRLVGKGLRAFRDWQSRQT